MFHELILLIHLILLFELITIECVNFRFYLKFFYILELSTEMLEKIASNLWISNSYPNCSQYEQFTFEYLILFMDVGIENLEFMKIIYYSVP